jgi:hypothetical protein
LVPAPQLNPAYADQCESSTVTGHSARREKRFIRFILFVWFIWLKKEERLQQRTRQTNQPILDWHDSVGVDLDGGGLLDQTH